MTTPSTPPAASGAQPVTSTALSDVHRSPPVDRRLRARWRILIAFVASLLVVVLADTIPFLGFADTAAGYVVATVGRLVAVVGVLALTARWIDRRRLRDYGLRGGRSWWADAGFGAAVGFGMFALSAGVGIAAGWIQVRDTLSPAASGGVWLILALVTLRFAAVSLWEEVLFRGVIIRNAAESFGRRWPRTRAVLVATVISTLVFALVHVPQSLGAEDMSLARMAIMWVTIGGLLAVPYLVSGQLALSLGLHLTINLAVQNVFVLWDQQAEHSAVVLHLGTSGAEVLAGAGGVLQVGAIALGYLVVLGWLRWRYGPLRVHPSLTEIPATAQPPSPTGLDPADADEGPRGGDTAPVVSAGCASRTGSRPWEGTEGP